MGAIAFICIIFLTLFFPPIGVFATAGCGMDLFINVCLTILGFIPGTVHAFYVLYVYYDRREQYRNGLTAPERAPGIYSDRVQGGGHRGYGTM